MSEPDKDLQDRIVKLNASSTPLPSVDELTARFNKLFATDPAVAQKAQASATSYSVPSGADDVTDDEIERMLLEESLLNDADDFADLFGSTANNPHATTAATAKSALDTRLDAAVDSFIERDPTFLGGMGDADADALIHELGEEAALESKYGELRKKMDEDLEERYRRLKQDGVPVLSGGGGGKVVEIKKGREAPAGLGPPPKAIGMDEFRSEEDEIENWCTICNEDAKIVCHGCDDDRYCKACFREAHTGPGADYDARTHRWKEFVARGRV
ncbi:hypothetical protein BC936DRAFT_143449 [Jimgerdemannia flammicorona]|uniref:Uncharacterized protein n=1 Tax=Jimgerdemannia flammicorona TaxID=994334 RepID=A0A432ZYZ6_9FUNG|nr:hypothetical protein BC936DRAFT_143449 [Jimgerdemannia flammicorona]